MKHAPRIGTSLAIYLILSCVPSTSQERLTDISTISRRLQLFAPATITADLSSLGKDDRQALKELLDAARVADKIFLWQIWQESDSLLRRLSADSTDAGRTRLRYFSLNMGPWSVADRFRTFIEGVPAVKPPRGTLYPADMNRSEWGTWFIKLSTSDQKKAAGALHIVKRDSNNNLTTVPYATEYARFLAPASGSLLRAADLVTDSSTRKALLAISRAFTDDDYRAAEQALITSDGPISFMMAPTDKTVDGLFQYKGGFEAFLSVRNPAESGRLKMLEGHLSAMEKHLTGKSTPDRNKKAEIDIRVDDVLYLGGGSRRGSVGTAIRLPSDRAEANTPITGVTSDPGSSRKTSPKTRMTLLRNVHEAKFKAIQQPIAALMLDSVQAAAVTFDLFFLHLMAHELSHRFDVARIDATNPTPGEFDNAAEDNRMTDALDEARADAAGVAGIQYLIDGGTQPKSMERSLYPTLSSSLLRALRFGLTDSYSIGAAIQVNYFLERKAIVPGTASQRFRVDIGKMKTAVKELFLEISAVLSSPLPEQRAAFVAKYALLPASLSALRDRLSAIPYDLEPTFSISR